MSLNPDVTVKVVNIGPSDAMPDLPGFTKKSSASHKIPINLKLDKPDKPKRITKKKREANKIETFKQMGEALLTKHANHTYLETHNLSKDIADIKFNVVKLTEDVAKLQASKNC
jgi:hypothetical protein